MTKEEELNKINEEIQQCERNRRDESFFLGKSFFNSKLALVGLTAIISIGALFAKRGIFSFKTSWVISIDQFITWISIGFFTIVVILIVVSFIYRSLAKKGNVAIDVQIENLKARYLQVQNER